MEIYDVKPINYKKRTPPVKLKFNRKRSLLFSLNRADFFLMGPGGSAKG